MSDLKKDIMTKAQKAFGAHNTQVLSTLEQILDSVIVEFDEADNMCPNCITPWKCNGPHLSDQTVAAKRNS